MEKYKNTDDRCSLTSKSDSYKSAEFRFWTSQNVYLRPAFLDELLIGPILDVKA